MSPKKRLKPGQLLEPAVQDRLPLVGWGFSARIFRYGPWAVKVAHPNAVARERIREELQIFQHLVRDRFCCQNLPKLVVVQEDQTAFVRSFYRLPTLYQLLLQGVTSQRLVDRLWPFYQQVEALRLEQGFALDFSPSNLYVDASRGRFYLADLGRRIAPPLYPELSLEQLSQQLLEYPRWRQRLDHRDRLRPFFMPPSGRFCTEVDTGPADNNRLLWVNTGLQRRLGLSWSKGRMAHLASLSTHASKKTGQHLATRYQDAPGIGPEDAQGDGRVIYAGCIKGGPNGLRELQVKGCGPTPLAWRGHEFHFDGFVSFQRTLWETTVCDELHRLGFETPEVLAISATGQTTVDNTLERWPAASALRISNSHFRLGHLHRWSGDPEAFAAICLHIGQRVVRSDFAVEKSTHLKQLVRNFASNLGSDAGRSHALNIHCFNPTMGNLRVDGHFLDFSTIRFFRYHLPDYTYLDGKRRVCEHRQVLRRHVLSLSELFVSTGYLSSQQAKRLTRAAFKLYDDRFNEGYLQGLGQFLGGVGFAGSAQQKSVLVDETVRLRAVRSQEYLDFPFWQQRHRAPLFDLEGRAPEFIAAWRRGELQPWQKLRSPFEGAVKPAAKHTAQVWFAILQQLVPPAQLRQLRPRRYDEIIRPFVEINHLTELCYRRSSPEEFTQWQRAIATSRHLPPGDYSYLEARQQAQQLGHLSFLGLMPNRYETLVGMTQELYDGICDILDDVLKDSLIAVVASGIRVMTRDRLRQLCPGQGVPAGGHKLRQHGRHPRESSPLELLAFVDHSDPSSTDPQNERELGERLIQLGVPFPLCRFVPPRIPVVPTEHLRSDSLIPSLLQSPPRLGRRQIFPEQTVLFYDPQEGRPLDPIGRVCTCLPGVKSQGHLQRVPLAQLVVDQGKLTTGCPLSIHQLELCLRDNPKVEAPAVTVHQIEEGLWQVSDHGGAVLASQQAGREDVAVFS